MRKNKIKYNIMSKLDKNTKLDYSYQRGIYAFRIWR